MGLMNDIPAEFVDNLLIGHELVVEFDEHTRLELGLNEIRFIHGDDSNVALDDEQIEMLLHVLVTRDLIQRAERDTDAMKQFSNREHVTRFLKVYGTGGNLHKAWDRLIETVEPASALIALRKEVGADKTHEIYHEIHGGGHQH